MLQDLRDLDPSPQATILKEIVLSYCACSTKLMLQLRSACEDRDAAVIEQAAHSMKGASSQVGAIILAGICSELINCAGKGENDQYPVLCERIAIEHTSVIAALNKEMQAVAA